MKKIGIALLLSCSLLLASPVKVASVLLPGTSPLVTFRILVTTGSAFDPPGKEGLAGLTASMLAQGGTRGMSYDQIVQALYPMASSVSAQVDKEMTVFTGTSHIENLDRYYSLLKDMKNRGAVCPDKLVVCRILIGLQPRNKRGFFGAKSLRPIQPVIGDLSRH